jgi:hypothetical protein
MYFYIHKIFKTLRKQKFTFEVIFLYGFNFEVRNLEILNY